METESIKPSIQREITMSAGAANLYALVFLLPLLLVLALPYYYLWPEQFTTEKIRYYLAAREALTYGDIAIGLIILLLGVMAHELLHGLGWSIYTQHGWRSIRFGIMWSFLTPYCHCSEPLAMKSYRIGSILPALVLGFLPSLIAMAIGNLGLMIFGFFFTFAAGGDFLMLWLLRKEKPDALVEDHPDRIGCTVISDSKAKK